MKRALVLIASLWWLGGLSPGPSQETTSPRPARSRRALLGQIHEDIGKAVAHASLTGKQSKKLADAQDRLRRATETGARGRNNDARKALNDIEKVFKSGPFKPEDRQMVLDDIRRLREMGVGKQAQRRARRPPPVPRFPPPLRRRY